MCFAFWRPTQAVIPVGPAGYSGVWQTMGNWSSRFKTPMSGGDLDDELRKMVTQRNS